MGASMLRRFHQQRRQLVLATPVPENFQPVQPIVMTPRTLLGLYHVCVIAVRLLATRGPAPRPM
eukprot:117483-Chlamydomonas_euryale.AAC.1